MSHFNITGSTKKFIGPTHGLPSRSAGKGMTSNLENVGGRILVEAEMTKHKDRMKKIKPIINVELPWAHRQAQRQQQQRISATKVGSRLRQAADYSSSHRPGSAADYSRGLSSQRPTTADTFNRSATQPRAQQQQQPAPVAEFDLLKLTSEQQHTYHDMIRVLCALPDADAKALLEQMYRESEDKKLLSAYTGVFPTLDSEAAEGPPSHRSGSSFGSQTPERQ